LSKEICDGYIVPRLKSPYHIGDEAHEEIVIFEPSKYLSLVKSTSEYLDLEPKSINDLISEYSVPVIINKKLTINMKIPKRGGNKEEYIDKNDFFNNKKLCKEAIKSAKKYVKSLNITLTTKMKNLKPHVAMYISEKK
jgi:hypothetical protein